MTGRLQTMTNDWSIVTLDGSGGLNSAPQSAPGSININDAYIRSVGLWLSQINFNGYTGPQGPAGPPGPPGPQGPAGSYGGPHGPVIGVNRLGCGEIQMVYSDGYVEYMRINMCSDQN